MKFRLMMISVLVMVSFSQAGETNSLDQASDAALKAAIAGNQRSEENKARDQFRHPYETLSFFGVTKDLTVVEISPGGGWYTEILAPYLKESGKYYAAGFDPASSERRAAAVERFNQKLQGNESAYGKVVVTIFGEGHEVAPAGTADVVLTFRNIHNWMGGGTIESSFAAFNKALKPGGILGVVEHRANTDKDQDPKAENGYVRQDYVIALAQAAGFELVASSEVNANARDTKDWAQGVWTLPPVLATKDEDGGKHAEFGESDRMTLKFRKK